VAFGDAVISIVCPVHNESPGAVIVTTGAGNTSTTEVALLLHPFTSVIVVVYVIVEAGETETVLVVAPVLHK
jgi:hypothetical protein